MDCRVKWTMKAWQTYNENIAYLQRVWTEKEVSKFILLVDKKIENLVKHPKIGSPRNPTNSSIRITIVHKRILLIYNYQEKLNEIYLLVFWNTYLNPKKMPIK